ncbi:MAG: MmcQ/YjbR family DNA-binding protein [Flavobacteriales bacterium]|nr:MmcQ/YjbR family DNA-binding protein [Flavobacteriales bacterium]
MDVTGARDIALGDQNAEEYDHFGKVAFRIRPKKAGAKPGRTFMTLWLDEGHAVLMLDLEQQTELIAHHPAEFEAHPSKWGAKGATIMHLTKVTEKQFRHALSMAIKNATR